MSSRPIILAEDNEKLRRLYTDYLEAAGLTVMAVSDGEKAVALLHKVANPQLIILDIMMPRMNGIETCGRIRKLQGVTACPILFLTALDRPETLLECLLAGGDDYLMKSSPLAEILERVQYWSRRGALEDIGERRERAITQLERIVAQMDSEARARAGLERSDEAASLSLLTEFVAERSAGFEGELLQRCGWLAGLMEAAVPEMDAESPGGRRFLRKLMLRTPLVDDDEIETVLENLERIARQSGFREGRARGCDDAADLQLPQRQRLLERLGER